MQTVITVEFQSVKTEEPFLHKEVVSVAMYAGLIVSVTIPMLRHSCLRLCSHDVRFHVVDEAYRGYWKARAFSYSNAATYTVP